MPLRTYSMALVALLALSAWRPCEIVTWAMEVAPVLMLGGHYSYARVPLGDPWETQKDMLLAWIGAMAAQWLLARWHDRQLAALPLGTSGRMGAR